MYILNYEDFRDHLVDAMMLAGLRARTDEVLYLTDMTRGCEIHVSTDDNAEEPWGKLAFEWTSENQALSQRAHARFESGNRCLEDLDLVGNKVGMHAAFHLHFDGLRVGSDVIRDVTEIIRTHAEGEFGPDGDVVAEVRLTAEYAGVECLRFEVHAECPLVSTEPWWDEWGEVFATMLAKFEEIYGRLETEFGGSDREVSE